jgi:hypothetical protein
VGLDYGLAKMRLKQISHLWNDILAAPLRRFDRESRSRNLGGTWEEQ